MMATVYFISEDERLLLHILLRDDDDDIFNVSFCGVELDDSGHNGSIGARYTEQGIDAGDICVECCEGVGRLRKNDRGGIDR